MSGRNNRNQNGGVGGHRNNLWAESDSDILEEPPHMHRTLNTSYGTLATQINEANSRLAEAQHNGRITPHEFEVGVNLLNQLVLLIRDQAQPELSPNVIEDTIRQIVDGVMNGNHSSESEQPSSQPRQ